MDMAYLDLWATIVAILVTSLIWRIYRVRCHRFDRYNALHKKYARLVNDLDRMTYEEAGKINQLTLYWDFPFAATSAMSFALFKTYAVPTISRVLNMSDELASSALAARRAEDTAILLIELHTNGLDSVAGSTALARINYLHSRYGKLITRDDLLYTLSLFVFEPVDFLKAYEWRELSALEVHARYVYWREIGARMGIADIPLTLEDLRTWSDEYAERATLYDPDNSRTAEATIAVLTAAFPGFLKPLAKQVVLVFLDERVRTAFGWQPAFPSIFYTLVPVILRLRAFVMGYLLYPRTKRPAYTQTVRVNGKYMRKGFFFEPWYVQTGASSFGQAAYVVPGGPQWQDEGFRHCSLGPARLARTGVEETVENATMMRERAAVCPFFI